MKFSVLLDILIELLTKRRVTASYLSEKYELSPRTIYRYVSILSETVPLHIKHGRGGGICLSDSYTLPVGFLKEEEYEAAIEALSASYARSPETRFLEAKRKLSAQVKTESRERAIYTETDEVLIDENASLFPRSTVEKLRLIGACIRSMHVMEIEYVERNKKNTHRIEPHALILEENSVSVYAFCYTKRAFHLFRLGRIFSAVKTEEAFRKRPFERAEIPLSPLQKTVNVRLEIEETALERARDWLGVENVRMRTGKWFANASFLGHEELAYKLLSFGAGIKVLSPTSLKNRVAALAEEIVKSYS